MKTTAITILILLVLLIALATGQEPGLTNYFSSNGKFVISYPDDWAQMDYNTVDYFLMSSDASEQALNYDAVFALKESIPFHKGPYFILTVDTSGPLNQIEVDSLLEQLSETFGEGIKYFPTGDYLADLESHAPNWDAEKRQITILNNITEQYKIIKRNLWVMQFYDGGIANFYFFAADSLFVQYRPVFEQIISSFTTENLEAAIPKQNLKLANIEDSPDTDSGSNALTIFGLPFTIVVALLIIVIARKRRRARRNNEEEKLEN